MIHQIIYAQWDDREGHVNLNVHAELYGNLSATPSLWHPFDTGKKRWLYLYTGVFLFWGSISVQAPRVGR